MDSPCLTREKGTTVYERLEHHRVVRIEHSLRREQKKQKNPKPLDLIPDEPIAAYSRNDVPGGEGTSPPKQPDLHPHDHSGSSEEPRDDLSVGRPDLANIQDSQLNLNFKSTTNNFLAQVCPMLYLGHNYTKKLFAVSVVTLLIGFPYVIRLRAKSTFQPDVGGRMGGSSGVWVWQAVTTD